MPTNTHDFQTICASAATKVERCKICGCLAITKHDRTIYLANEAPGIEAHQGTPPMCIPFKQIIHDQLVFNSELGLG